MFRTVNIQGFHFVIRSYFSFAHHHQGFQNLGKPIGDGKIEARAQRGPSRFEMIAKKPGGFPPGFVLVLVEGRFA